MKKVVASWFWIGVYLIEAVIVYQYISTLYEKRQTPKVILLLWTFVYFSMFLISKTERVWLNILVFFLLNSLLTLISFEIKPISAIFHSIVLTASMCLTEIIPIAAFSELISKYEKNRFLEYGVVLITLFSKLLFFISTRIMIAICGDKKTKPICDKNGSIINVVPIVSIGIYYVLLQICLRCSVEYDIQIMITLSGLALLIINITVFWEHERVIKKDQEKYELEMMIQKQQNEVEYYKLMAERNEEQKILIHDFKKHMEYIKYLYSEGLSEEEATFLYTDLLKYGDTGIEVEYIHYFLDAIAFLDRDIPRLPTNSIYNNNTVTIVKAFQEKYGLPVTGEFDYNDWTVLKNAYRKILKSFPLEYQEFVNDLYHDYFLVFRYSLIAHP